MFQRLAKLGIIGFFRARIRMGKLRPREDEAIQEPWAHFNFSSLRLRVPTRGKVGAHVTLGAGRSRVPAARLAQRSPGAASPPRGRCCTKPAGRPPTGWWGSGQLCGLPADLWANGGPDPQRRAEKGYPAAWPQGAVQGTERMSPPQQGLRRPAWLSGRGPEQSGDRGAQVTRSHL